MAAITHTSSSLLAASPALRPTAHNVGSRAVPCATPNTIMAGRRAVTVAAAGAGAAEVATDSNSGSKFTSPKAGAVGEARFKQGALPGTYWGPPQEAQDASSSSNVITVAFDTGSGVIEAEAQVGENLLRVAERCGAMRPSEEFCFEGTCCYCEMDVQGGATEVGYRSYGEGSELIRSCICPVPQRPSGSKLHAKVLSEEDAWGDGVL